MLRRSALLHLSGRLLRPASPRFPGPLNPALPSCPRSTRPRFLSSSSSPTPGRGAGWATHDYDPLIESLCASASDTPVESDAWFVFDPVSGRIVIQRPPVEEEGEGAGELEDEEKAGVKGKEMEKGKGKWKRKKKGRASASASGEKGQTKLLSVAAARKPAVKGGKERVSYVCSNCGEGDSQWWGICRHCKATRTLQKNVEKAVERERERENGKGEGNGEMKRKGWASSSGEKGQTRWSSVAAPPKSAGKGGKERVSYMCSHCGEGDSRWWGICRHCKAKRTLQKRREMVLQSLQEVSRSQETTPDPRR